MLEPRKRYSFYNPVNGPSFIQGTNDDEAERAMHREEGEIETRISRMSISNLDASLSNSTPISDLPLFQLQHHFETCLKMFTTNKINNQNVWQLDIFTYLRNLLKSDEDFRNILQVAGISLDVGTKIYCVRVDDVHTEVLKLANALNKVHIKEIKENDPQSCDDDSDNENKESKSQKTKRLKRKFLDIDIDNRITICPSEEGLNAPIKKNNLFSSQCTDINDNSFLNVQYQQKPGLSFQLLTPSEAKNYKWSELDTKPSKNNFKMIDSSILPPLPDNCTICPSFSNFAVDQWDIDDERRIYSEKDDFDQPIVDEKGNFIHNLDPELDDIDDHCAENNTMISNVGVAPHDAGKVVYITDMKPNNDSVGTFNNSEYSFRPLPNVSDRFKITGIWAGPAHWKLKWVRRPEQKKVQLPEAVKTVARRSRKCKPFEFIETSIEEIKEMLINANKRTVRNTRNAEEACTLSEYMDILADKRVSLLNRPEVKVYRRDAIENKEPVDGLNVTSYDYDNLNDGDYCPSNPLNDWGDDNDENLPDDLPESNPEVNEYQQELYENNSIQLIEKPDNIVTGTFVPYAQTAKKMNMKKLKHAIWDLIPKKEENCIDVDKPGTSEENPKSTKFSEIYKELPNGLSSAMSESLSAPLAFVALLHLANENNLSLANDDSSDIIININD